MSETAAAADAWPTRTPRETVLNLYAAILGVLLVGILALTAYVVRLGPLVGPGVESSFGFAAALMFLMGALMVHTAEATYRLWPLGRRFLPSPPGPVTDRMIANFVRVLVLVVVGGVIAYVLAGLVM